MGFYIEVPGIKDKVEQIQKIYDATVIDAIDAAEAVKAGQGAVVCVVSNPHFDAAAYCPDYEEFRRFISAEDPRPKTWLLIQDRERIDRDSGRAASQQWAARQE